MEIAERAGSRRAAPTGSSAQAADADRLRAEIRAALVARVRAESNRHLAEVSERRARHLIVNGAMHLRAARRLRIQAGAADLEARHHESAAAWIRNVIGDAELGGRPVPAA